MTRHHAAWMQTFTGRAFDPCDPAPEMIAIEDIAHALSNLCRFAGHSRLHYSVGEHCVRASHAAAELLRYGGGDYRPISIAGLERAALMHDAAEAYLVDVPSPIKVLITGYKELELKTEAAICARFGVALDDLHHPLVKHIDLVMLSTEKRDLFGPAPRPWGGLPAPMQASISPWPATVAEELFLDRFRELFP